MTAADWISAVQLAVVIGGGGFALFKFLTRPERSPVLTVESSARLVHRTSFDRSIILVTLRTTNTSGVPVKVGSAAVVLFRVSIEEGALRFDQEAQEDPLDYVSQMTSDQQAIESGRPFGRREGRTHSLAPGETVKTDVAFPVVTTPGGLMAIRVRMEANKKKENIIAWTSFSYLNLESATTARRRWLLRPRSLVGDA